MILLRTLLIVIFATCAQSGWSEVNSLFKTDTFQNSNSSIIPAHQTNDANAQASSLFIGQDGQSFFAPFPDRVRVTQGGISIHQSAGVVGLRHIIGQAESRRDGYDAVQHGARIRPDKRPTQMTIGEIYAWIDATPGQPHAIGRFQFIPTTLRRVVAEVGFSRETIFSPRVQDQLADVLLAEAGIHRFDNGLIGRHQFMNNLAKIWAGLPTSNGKSHYDGYAGNKASMTWADFDSQMQQAFQS